MKPDLKKLPATSRPIQMMPPPINQGKIILAVVLIGVMGFLWIRVFLRGKPAAASAKPTTTQAAAATAAIKTAPVVRFSYVPLAVVPGRHDRLTRDLFSVPDSAIFPWQQKPVPQAEQPNAVTPVEDPWEKQIRPFMERIVVDAIGTDPKGTAQVFIQDRFLSIGDRFSFKLGQQQYELKVKEIHSNSVVLEWQDHSVTLKMSEPGMSGDK